MTLIDGSSRLEPGRGGRHFARRRRHPVTVEVVAGMTAALLIIGAVWVATGRPEVPARTVVRTVPSSSLPPHAPRTAAPGPPSSVVIDGHAQPNPIMETDAPGVTYAGPAYTGAPQIGTGPLEQSVPGYGLPGCPLYVGRQQVGVDFDPHGATCTPPPGR